MKRKDRVKIINRDAKIIFAGRFDETGKSGPQQFAAGMFNEYCKTNKAVFLEYYFDGRKHSFFKKLFGSETRDVFNGKIITAGLFRIIPLLTTLKPDIIHLLTFERFAVFFYIYKLFFKVKIFYNSHGVIYYENSILKSSSMLYTLKDRFCEKIYLKFSDRIIFPSEITLDLAEKFYKISENKVLILPNLINSRFFNVKNRVYSENELKAVFIYKNVLNRSGADLLKEILKKDISDIKYYIITDENDINLPDSVNPVDIMKILPNEELPDFYSDKDIFLSLNNYDTFSISTGEAMAAGLIPVITEQTGISRFIENGINGFKFNYNDTGKPAIILEQLTKMNESDRKKISLSASESIAEISPENVMEIYKTEYKASI